ncbi:MAG: hypothetical protein E6767_11315 [Dysgonomonas sp.]|nr:hypothetical protein [Dysgonomonas sp.]
MKNNSTLKDWLFSPFKFIAGGKALILGIITMLLLSILAYFSITHFDGAIDIHYGFGNSPYLLHAYYQICNWIVLTIVFYITAYIVTKSSIRFIDIAGTLALSQAPLIIAALWGLTSMAHLEISGEEMRGMRIDELTTMLKDNILGITLTVFVILIPAIWNIILKYNAYSVSANIKGNKGVMSFIIALLISEVITKVLNYFIVPIILQQ